jgi:hypothetical protein
LLGDLDALGHEYVRMLPAIYDTLNRLGVQDPVVERLKGFYRRSWYHHHLLARHVVDAVATLDEANIPSLVTKGMAVVACCIENPAVRPMGDFDLLVPSDGLHAALERLETRGWTRTETFHIHPLPSYIHALHLQLVRGIFCDLHWIASPYLRDISSSGDIWGRSRRVSLGSGEINVPSPTDQLLLALVHGARWGTDGRLAWVGDALALLKLPDIDWDVLIRTAKSNHATVAAEETLRFLQRFGAPIPEGVVEGFEEVPRFAAERLGFRGEAAPPRGSEWRRRAARMLWPFVRATAGRGPFAMASGLPLYVKEMWNVTSWREIGKAAWLRMRGRHASPTPMTAHKRPAA